MTDLQCTVCGGRRFTSRDVLWQQLVDDWQLSPFEAAYVNRQQGESCDACGANLRSIALANAVRAFLGTDALLQTAVTGEAVAGLEVLEINEAGSLTPVLQTFPHYRFGAFPEVDMHALPYPDDTFDLVVHSDTLEHIENPVHGLQECRRILKPDGALCFTVPTIVGRLSRTRTGLEPSYHGNAVTTPDDFVVHTEFGADAWTFVLAAGFARVDLHAVEYPAAIALSARKGRAAI